MSLFASDHTLFLFFGRRFRFSDAVFSTPRSRCFGQSVSLYDTDQLTGLRNGEPNADSFGAFLAGSGAVMCIADGVGWGVGPQLASQHAVEGALAFLQKEVASAKTVRQLGHVLHGSMRSAQRRIITQGGTLTTFLVCAAARLTGSTDLVVVAYSVGDCRAFAVSPTKSTREVTVLRSRSDMRDPGGCLGFAIGEEPDLAGASYHAVRCAPGDIIVLCSDGVHDNWDPTVRRAPREQWESPGKPEMTARIGYALRHLRTVAAAGVEHRDAQAIVGSLIADLDSVTGDNRATLEKLTLEYKDLPRGERSSRIIERLKECPGKLDHATILAFIL